MDKFIIAVFASVIVINGSADMQKIKIKKAVASHVYNNYAANRVFDGYLFSKSRWIGKKSAKGELWIELRLANRSNVGGVHLFSGFSDHDALQDFYFEFKDASGKWIKIPSSETTGNRATALRMPFDATVKVDTDALRLVVEKTKGDLARVKEIVVWPDTGKAIPEIEKHEVKVPLIYLNQSGFNLHKPKRFTAPTLKDGTPFQVINKRTGASVFCGKLSGRTGGFSSFNPDSRDEYVVRAGGHESFPFRIGHWWLERVTYRNAVIFMIQSRHYFGDYKHEVRGSHGWRDDHHYGWEVNTLVAQYLSNPSAYERMPKSVRYQCKAGFNGAFEPFKDDAPDIVKLIHFGADLAVTQKLDHIYFKQQLAFFLYAWPVLKKWLPEQNYIAARDFVFSVWGNKGKSQKYTYDRNSDHNMFTVKTRIGTTKGDEPPGHTVLPNLLMYEVAKREGRSDAERYFKAASDQVDWMIKNLNWNDPLTTKGQRQAEHITMTGLAMMLKSYPDRAPAGLKEKIEAWKKVAISRSANMWDFRKYSATQWCPTGPQVTMWNEPGNLLGFPACALAAISATPDSPLNKRLRQISKAQMDNAFGRNPTGRVFSYDAPREIEGCDLGWYSFYPGGLGHLPKTRFVFDGAPKNALYPYNPQVGNIGWTEGWIEFNTAFNISLAYMAYDDIKLQVDKKRGIIRLKAPLNFDYDKVENAKVQMRRDGILEEVELTEESPNSAWLSTSGVNFSGVSEVSYGYGYFKHRVGLAE